jgi:hypothetical protein
LACTTLSRQMAFLVAVHISQIRCTLILHMARLPTFVIYYSGRLLRNVLCRPLCSHHRRRGGWGHPWRLWHAWSYTLTRLVPSRVLVWGRRGRSSMSGLVSSSRHFEELALSHCCRRALTAHGRGVDADTACDAAYHRPRPPHRVASIPLVGLMLVSLHAHQTCIESIVAWVALLYQSLHL